MSVNQPDLAKLHQEVLWPQVRIKAERAGGSGTIIYSTDKSTFAISCDHVISEAVKIRKEWDSKVGKEAKREYRQVVTVEFFDYENSPHGHRPITYTVDGDIVAYDKPHDMALIKLRVKKPYPYVAKLLPKDKVETIQIGTPVHAVGAALLHDPILTTGIVTHMGDEIDYKDYWMSNANIIFGNSGGAIFTAGTHEFLGIPSRIDIAGWGSPITHLGYFSPITRVYQFLEEQLYQFIYDKGFTEEQCAKQREEAKKNAKPFNEDSDDDEEEKTPTSPYNG